MNTAGDKDSKFMLEALKLAREAVQKNEVPVGAVIVHKNRIVARAHNQVEMLADPTAHAEMVAVTQATNYVSSKWLQECSVYVTLEPCSMCVGALVLARIKRLYIGANDPKAGACGSVFNIAESNKLNHRIEVQRGLLAEECGSILSEFFVKKRKKFLEIAN